MKDLEIKIKNIASEVVSPQQKIISVVGDKNSGYVRIVLDGENNISLTDTTLLTTLLKKSLEFEALFPSGYRLEVTSPGIDTPLQYPFQYKKNIGKKIIVSYIENGKDIDSIASIIDADDKSVFLKIDKSNIKLAYEKIKIAKLKILFN